MIGTFNFKVANTNTQNWDVDNQKLTDHYTAYIVNEPDDECPNSETGDDTNMHVLITWNDQNGNPRSAVYSLDRVTSYLEHGVWTIVPAVAE
jgi:hypothetical protein